MSNYVEDYVSVTIQVWLTPDQRRRVETIAGERGVTPVVALSGMVNSAMESVIANQEERKE